MTSSQRGYDYKWQKAREQYLRDNPLCVYCERNGRTTAARVVDHIVAHRGDMVLFWDQTNWQSLCKPCHDSVKQAEEAAGLGGCHLTGSAKPGAATLTHDSGVP